jgi:hypothetical protein
VGLIPADQRTDLFPEVLPASEPPSRPDKYEPGATLSLRGVIPAEEVVPASDVESSRSLKLMRRAAMAIIQARIEAPERRMEEVLASAGIPMASYWQMVESADWLPTLRWAVTNATMTYFYPDVLLSTGEMARRGDPKARTAFLDLIEKFSQSEVTEIEKILGSLDDQAFSKEIDETMRSIHALQADLMSASKATRDAVTEEARAQMLKRSELSKPQQTIDHQTLHEHKP